MTGGSCTILCIRKLCSRNSCGNFSSQTFSSALFHKQTATELGNFCGVQCVVVCISPVITTVHKCVCECLYRHKPSRGRVELVGQDQGNVIGTINVIVCHVVTHPMVGYATCCVYGFL